MDILFEKVYTLVTITPQGVRRKLEVQDMGLNLSGMTTETRNPRTMQLDQMSPLEIVTVMNEEDARVPLAIAKCLPQIAQAKKPLSRLWRAQRTAGSWLLRI